jgi:hypothetical protein
LVGFTDGLGSFSFHPKKDDKPGKNGKLDLVAQLKKLDNQDKNNIWEFSYSLEQHESNVQLLYKIKSNLKVGTVSRKNTTSRFIYSVTDLNHLIDVIFPIFDKYHLHTSKLEDYNKFKYAVYSAKNRDFDNLKIQY